ncbi:hypothetical protein V6N13_053320 [Hibiscus sabdariffa]
MGKADLDKFTEELTSGLDWIINHCFSLQDVSSMRDAIKNHFEWDESESESEAEGGVVDQFAQPEKFDVATLYDNDDKYFVQKEEPNVKEEKMKPREELI